MPMPPSKIRKYFKEVTDTKFKCQVNTNGKLCNVIVTRGGIDPSKRGNGCFHTHMKRYHTALHTELKAKEVAEEENSRQQPVALAQPNIGDALQQVRNYPDNHPRQIKLTQALLDWIIVDDQAFTVVNSPSFKRLLFELDRQYSPPSDATVRRNLVPRLYVKLRRHIQLRVARCSGFAATTDMWTNRFNNSYMSLTLHFIDDWVRKFLVLRCAPYTGSHAADALAHNFQTTLASWSLIDDKAPFVMRDNDPKIVKALRDMKLGHGSCLLHTTHLVVQDALFKTPSFQTMIQRVVKMVTKYRRSAVKSVINVLAPFKTITLCGSRHDASISEIIPMIRKARNKLNTMDVRLIGTLAENLLQGLDKYFYGVRKNPSTAFPNIEKTDHYRLATLLDPRFKGSRFREKENADAAVETLTKMIERVLIEHTDERPAKVPRMERNAGSAVANALDDSDDDEDDAPDDTSRSSGSDDGLINADARKYVSDYLNDPLQRSDSDPLDFYRKYGQALWPIAMLAKKYLAPPCSSIESERMFKAAGEITTNKRNRLKPTTVEKILFMKYNLKAIDFQTWLLDEDTNDVIVEVEDEEQNDLNELHDDVMIEFEEQNSDDRDMNEYDDENDENDEDDDNIDMVVDDHDSEIISELEEMEYSFSY